MDTYRLLMCLPALALVAWAAATDWRSRRIPNWLTFSLALGGLAQSLVFRTLCTPAQSVAGFAAGVALTFGLFAIRAVQGGDVKLLAGVGAWIGPVGALQVFCVEAIVGAVMVLVQAAAQGRLRLLLKNTAVLAVNLLHVKDVGLDHVAETGRSTRTVEVRLPYAVPILIAVAVLVAHNALPGRG